MKKRNNNKLLILLFVALNGLAQVPTTFDSFVTRIKKEHPLALRAGNDKAYGQYLQKAARGNFDPRLSASFENKYFTGTDYYAVGNAELKQPLYTSQYLKAGYLFGQGPYVNPQDYTPVAGLPYLGLQVSLLQGMMLDKNRAELIKGRHYADYYSASERVQLNDLLFQSTLTYADYLYAKKVYELYEYFNSLARQRLKAVSDLAVIGEKPAVDTIEASIFLQGRVLDRAASELELTKKQNELLVFMQAGSGQSTEKNIVVTDSLEEVYNFARKTLAASPVTREQTNPVIAQYSAFQNVLETESRLKREMIKPVLDVSYNFLGDLSGNNSVNAGFNNYKWGATFSLPLYLRKPRNEYRMATLVAYNNKLELNNKQNQIEFKYRFVFEGLNILSSQISNATRSAAFTRLLLEAERVKFESGESSLFLLNSREQKWLETEVKLAEYKQKFVKTFLELVYLRGELNYDLTKN